MDEILQKIDEAIENTKILRNGESRSAYLMLDGMVSGLIKAKSIIKAEQKNLPLMEIKSERAMRIWQCLSIT